MFGLYYEDFKFEEWLKKMHIIIKEIQLPTAVCFSGFSAMLDLYIGGSPAVCAIVITHSMMQTDWNIFRFNVVFSVFFCRMMIYCSGLDAAPPTTSSTSLMSGTIDL